MNYFVEIVKAIAWPITIIWLGYIFRYEIRLLADRLSSIRIKDVEASFTKQLAEAEAEAKKLNSLASKPTERVLSQIEQLSRIAEISPRAAIFEAWALIETTAAKRGISVKSANSTEITDFLLLNSEIDIGSLNLIEKLRRIKNQASKIPDFAISQNEAEHYLELAIKAASTLESLPKSTS